MHLHIHVIIMTRWNVLWIILEGIFRWENSIESSHNSHHQRQNINIVHVVSYSFWIPVKYAIHLWYFEEFFVAFGIETNIVCSSIRSFFNLKFSYFQSNSHSAIGTEAMKMIRKTSLMEMALNNNNDDGDGNNETIVKRSGGILRHNLSTIHRQ